MVYYDMILVALILWLLNTAWILAAPMFWFSIGGAAFLVCHRLAASGRRKPLVVVLVLSIGVVMICWPVFAIATGIVHPLDRPY